MSLLTLGELRALVTTGLDNTDLQDVVDREEGEIIRRFGPHADGVTPITEAYQGGGCDLFLKRAVVSVSSVSEALSLGGSATALTTAQYYLWPGQGRITRLTQGTKWGASVSVTYIPQDDRDRRKQVLIEIIRQALSQTALKSESVAGEYSYQAPDWEAQRNRLYRRLFFQEL